jgi:hypothetical protein
MARAFESGSGSMSTRLQPAPRLSHFTTQSVLALSWLTTVLAAVALAVSLTHHGPQGTRGEGARGIQGSTGQNATVAHLGVCEQDAATWLANFGNYSPGTYMPQLITAPVLTSGVPSCPVGSFVSIVPGG